MPQQPVTDVDHAAVSNGLPLACRLAHSCVEPALEVDDELADKVRTCLQDLIGCGFESLGKPWGRQAQWLAAPMASTGQGALRPSTIIGQAQAVSPLDAAFVNAVMGHGLVREDMHAASISHLGVAVLPAALALSQQVRISGRDFLSAVVVGYEVGARVGRALMDARIARIHRPTGISGPLAAAAAGSRILGLNVTQTTHALALAANTVGGFNEWGRHRIRVNSVGPTYVMTPELQARLDAGVRDLGKMMHVHALDFLPTPNDIAEAIAFLCSPAARAITGILLPVDSGWTSSATYMTYAGGVPWEQAPPSTQT